VWEEEERDLYKVRLELDSGLEGWFLGCILEIGGFGQKIEVKH
jgi:hypothetical protein